MPEILFHPVNIEDEQEKVEIHVLIIVIKRSTIFQTNI